MEPPERASFLMVMPSLSRSSARTRYEKMMARSGLSFRVVVSRVAVRSTWIVRTTRDDSGSTNGRASPREPIRSFSVGLPWTVMDLSKVTRTRIHSPTP